MAFGGNLPGALAITHGYDGTNWSTRPSLATARGYLGGCGTSIASLAIGGSINPAPANIKNATEEFTGETTSLNLKTITDS